MILYNNHQESAHMSVTQGGYMRQLRIRNFEAVKVARIDIDKKLNLVIG